MVVSALSQCDLRRSIIAARHEFYCGQLALYFRDYEHTTPLAHARVAANT